MKNNKNNKKNKGKEVEYRELYTRNDVLVVMKYDYNKDVLFEYLNEGGTVGEFIAFMEMTKLSVLKRIENTSEELWLEALDRLLISCDRFTEDYIMNSNKSNIYLKILFGYIGESIYLDVPTWDENNVEIDKALEFFDIYNSDIVFDIMSHLKQAVELYNTYKQEDQHYLNTWTTMSKLLDQLMKTGGINNVKDFSEYNDNMMSFLSYQYKIRIHNAVLFHKTYGYSFPLTPQEQNVYFYNGNPRPFPDLPVSEIIKCFSNIDCFSAVDWFHGSPEIAGTLYDLSPDGNEYREMINTYGHVNVDRPDYKHICYNMESNIALNVHEVNFYLQNYFNIESGLIYDGNKTSLSSIFDLLCSQLKDSDVSEEILMDEGQLESELEKLQSFVLNCKRYLPHIDIFLRRCDRLFIPFYNDVLRFGNNWVLQFGDNEARQIYNAHRKLNRFHEDLLKADVDRDFKVIPINNQYSMLVLVTPNNTIYNIKRIEHYKLIDQIYYVRNEESQMKNFDEDSDEDFDEDDSITEKSESYEWWLENMSEDDESFE